MTHRVREGLKTLGSRYRGNQAEYDESHIRRLRLIRVLVDSGGLSLATVREVVTAVEEQELTFTNCWV